MSLTQNLFSQEQNISLRLYNMVWPFSKLLDKMMWELYMYLVCNSDDQCKKSHCYVSLFKTDWFLSEDLLPHYGDGINMTTIITHLWNNLTLLTSQYQTLESIRTELLHINWLLQQVMAAYHFCLPFIMKQKLQNIAMRPGQLLHVTWRILKSNTLIWRVTHCLGAMVFLEDKKTN